MLIPIRHENMSARRWPVITLGLIVVNVLAFILTTSRMDEQMSAAGRPLSDADVDPIADLVTLRSRIADTRRIYRYAVDALKKNPAWRSDQSLALSTSRQLDAQTAKAQRMAAALGISKEAT